MSETLITWPDVCVFCGDSNGKVGRTANEHWKQFRCGTEYEVIEGKTAWIQDDECKIAELRTALAAATKRAEEAEATANLYQVELRLAGEEQLRRNEEHAREVAGCRDLIAKQRTRIAWLESISEPDDFRDHVAISAMQSLILKVPLHDRKGEYGIHSPEIADIHQVRLDIAGSAYDYADAMRTARCEQRVADEPTPPVEFTVNADGPLDDEALRCAGEVARQVMYGKRRKG